MIRGPAAEGHRPIAPSLHLSITRRVSLRLTLVRLLLCVRMNIIRRRVWFRPPEQKAQLPRRVVKSPNLEKTSACKSPKLHSAFIQSPT